MKTQITSSDGLEYFESSENKTIVPKIKYVTLEKGSTRKYNRKSKTNDKAKALIDEMLNKQSLEQSIEQLIEQPTDPTDLGEILDKYHEERRINLVQMKLDIMDYDSLQMYFDLIKETIAAGDERIYEYILNWMAWIIQNKGKKSRAAFELHGRLGIGKNRFTDIIAELTG
ncbi:MAG: hypothetical protein EZS28_018603 [Streblomastix strix]|uniref:Uncharacterized protein n=1 Tax=Streblomastix strix TaxID=222440 RepID=A0A5J4VTX7_9EUKA|nr:MAG: hypothetical protein EZS28_018603 [Streblomastix strix]